MIAYIVRRCLYAIPILIGVNVIVFLLFFFVNSPDDMARAHLGQKRVTPEQIDQWKREHSLDLPYFYNAGWRRIGAVVATKAESTAELLTAGEGNYALTIEAPPGQKTGPPRVGQARTVRIESDQPERLFLPAEFAAGTLSLPATVPTQQFAFRITPAQSAGHAPPTLRLTLTVEAPAPTQRAVLTYQAPIALLSRFTDTVFFQRSLRMLFFQYGKSDDGKIISEEVFRRIGPSLTITVPAFLLALLINVFFAMIVAVYRGTYVDYWSIILCVLLMSISGLFYIIGGQALVAKTLRLVPISGFDYGSHALKFALLPVLISIVSGLGGSVRFYRTIFLEEISKDYVRTARAKGLPESKSKPCAGAA